MAVSICTQALVVGRKDTGEYLGFNDQIAKLQAKTEIPVSKSTQNKQTKMSEWKAIEEDTQSQTMLSTCTHTNMSKHLHPQCHTQTWTYTCTLQNNF